LSIAPADQIHQVGGVTNGVQTIYGMKTFNDETIFAQIIFAEGGIVGNIDGGSITGSITGANISMGTVP